MASGGTSSRDEAVAAAFALEDSPISMADVEAELEVLRLPALMSEGIEPAVDSSPPREALRSLLRSVGSAECWRFN